MTTAPRESDVATTSEDMASATTSSSASSTTSSSTSPTTISSTSSTSPASTTPAENPSPSGLNPAAIGLGVGVGVGGIAIILLALFLLHRHRKRRAAVPPGLSPPDPTAYQGKTELPASHITEIPAEENPTRSRAEAPESEARFEVATDEGIQGRHELGGGIPSWHRGNP
ncbi:hypothetical protein F5X68DRAFT_277302 [Plectosphaerella plurivora]|uniref:Uncharacterized protein n=1 Tax=Plectosphaerella plurivora TaxID=936078 RepID=A0A9P9A6K4_9PEZI|nr:hypothetical protein F5X68DRAFT_277302 [Plectosphaerella plurivora]